MCLLFINFGFHLVFFLIIVCRRVTADDTLSLLALLKFLTIKSLNRNLKIAFYEERYILLAVKIKSSSRHLYSGFDKNVLKKILSALPNFSKDLM